MKLAKAVEKAKKEREKIKSPGEKKTKQSQSPHGNSKSADWSSPVYDESQLIKFDMKKAIDNKCISLLPDAVENEFYKVLRARVQQVTSAKNWKTIMVTSACPGDGKTLTSINLAVSMAKELNQTVLLMDNDLRCQSICRYMGIASDLGLADYFERDISFKDLIIWPGIDKLTIISGKRTITESAELLGSHKMQELVAEIKGRYDDRYIIFDMPPVLGSADVISFAPMVDSILMVVQEGKTSIQDVKKAVDLIPEEKFLGFVLNRQKRISKKIFNYLYR